LHLHPVLDAFKQLRIKHNSRIDTYTNNQPAPGPLPRRVAVTGGHEATIPVVSPVTVAVPAPGSIQSAPPATAALIQRNLRRLLVVAQQHFQSTGDNEVTGSQLMANPAILNPEELTVIAGEDYKKLVIGRDTKTLIITTSDGSVVALKP
jgi:hypothetical protein